VTEASQWSVATDVLRRCDLNDPKVELPSNQSRIVVVTIA